MIWPKSSSSPEDIIASMIKAPALSTVEEKTASVKDKVENSISPLPITMSCNSSFELAARCSGLTGRLRNVYRYGEVGQCSDLWSDFWFCMRVRGMPQDVREAQIHQRYREKEVQFLLGPNSERVWKERTEPRETFMHKDPDVVAWGRKIRWKDQHATT